MRPKARNMKEVIAEQAMELRLLKKHYRRLGVRTNEISSLREDQNNPTGRTSKAAR
jgi:hypothetical protein